MGSRGASEAITGVSYLARRPCRRPFPGFTPTPSPPPPSPLSPSFSYGSPPRDLQHIPPWQPNPGSRRARSWCALALRRDLPSAWPAQEDRLYQWRPVQGEIVKLIIVTIDYGAKLNKNFLSCQPIQNKRFEITLKRHSETPRKYVWLLHKMTNSRQFWQLVFTFVKIKT